MARRRRVMLQLQHVQRALGWCLVGVLLTYVLINAIGFVSPFWGLWRRPGDPGASSSLLHAWQSFTPWFSICFAVAAWHLPRTAQAMAARIGIVVLGALVPVAHVGASFARRTLDQDGSPVSPELSAPMARIGLHSRRERLCT